MGLTYHYRFEAPAETPARRLELFLRSVEAKVRDLKFKSTLVLNARFDSPERRAFARRLVSGHHVADERLKTATLPLQTHVWEHSPSRTRLIPVGGVVLLLVDEQDRDACFGFFQYPETVKDHDGRIVAESGLAGKWIFEDWLKTPDPRFRIIVKEFATAGYVIEETDDYRQG